MKVRKIIYKSGRVAWQVDYGLVDFGDGKRRKQSYFSSRDEAMGVLAEEKARRRRHGDAGVSLPDDLRVRFSAAAARLEAAGGTIEQAVELWVSRARMVGEDVPLGELLRRCLLAKKAAGKSVNYLANLKTTCLSFIRGRETQLASSVTREEIEGWICGNGFAAKTQKGYLTNLRSLFSWAMSARPRLLASNPAATARDDRFALLPLVDGEIELLSARAVRRLLVVAAARPREDRPQREDFGEFLWYVVLGCFCGIRPSEIRRLSGAQINLEDGHVIVLGRTAKTRQRRVVDLSPNARAWLAGREMPKRFSPLNFQRRWARLRAAAGLAKWPHDAMRHTFASMHYAQHQDEALLKAQMGHSREEEILFRHYRGLVTRREAAAFWGLRPGRLIADCK